MGNYVLRSAPEVAREVFDGPGLADYLGICRNRAYELMNTQGFPSVRVSPRRIIVHRDALIRWLDEQARGKAHD